VLLLRLYSQQCALGKKIYAKWMGIYFQLPKIKKIIAPAFAGTIKY